MLFGHTPALDLLGLMETEVLRELSEVNILLVGAADARHLLRTMAKWYTHGTGARVNFYLAEPLMDLVARQLLLILIALEPPDVLGPSEKVRLWMEVYGNSLLRPTTAEYVQSKSVQLVHMVTDPDYLAKRLPCVSLDKLKYKEKDGLENIFELWAKGGVDTEKSWDERQRRDLQTRYDSRDGAYDWDYHMRLREAGKETAQVGAREYKTWRRTGVAFGWPEVTASAPNPTFATGVHRAGDALLSFGYMGDIHTGPFVAFGLHSEDEEMTAVRGGTRVKRSTEVAERNLMRVFHEIQTGTPYDPSGAQVPDLGLVIVDVGEIKGEPPKELAQRPKKEEFSALAVPHRVVFLPADGLRRLQTRPELRGFFHLLYVGQSALQFLDPGVRDVLAPGALAALESRKYLVPIRKEVKTEFGRTVKDFAESAGWQPLGDFDPLKDEFALFKA